MKYQLELSKDGGGNFKEKKSIGEISYYELWMADQNC